MTLLQTTPRAFTRILSIGASRGDRVVPNDDLVGPIDSSDEWIRQRTGIVTRTRASDDVLAVDLAEAASKDALAKAGLTGADIDTVIVSTISNVAVTPSMAALLADRIGATPAPAFDISAACAGYVYGIAQADALVRSGVAEHVLVVGAEKLSALVEPTDRTISFLLGDGAGAAIVGPSEEPGISRAVWGSDGSKWDAVGMNASFPEHVAGAPWPTLRQDGQTVFRWAVWEMAKVAQQALEAAGVTADELGAFIPHQANMRIIDELAKQLKLPEHVLVGRDIETTGNTSAASVPLAAERLLRENPQLSGRLALQIGFGAGLVYGAQVVRLP